MFETKKAMKHRIEALEEELNAALAVNRLADRCGLSECKWIVCKSASTQSSRTLDVMRNGW